MTNDQAAIAKRKHRSTHPDGQLSEFARSPAPQGSSSYCSGSITTPSYYLLVLRKIPLVQILGLLGFLVFAVLHCVVDVAQHGLDGIWLREVHRQE